MRHALRTMDGDQVGFVGPHAELSRQQLSYNLAIGRTRTRCCHERRYRTAEAGGLPVRVTATRNLRMLGNDEHPFRNRACNPIAAHFSQTCTGQQLPELAFGDGIGCGRAVAHHALQLATHTLIRSAQ